MLARDGRVAGTSQGLSSAKPKLSPPLRKSLRATVDLNRPLSESVAGRVTALYENSGSYRNGASLERSGINPTLAWRSGATRVDLSYEHFRDEPDRRSRHQLVSGPAGRYRSFDLLRQCREKSRLDQARCGDSRGAVVAGLRCDRFRVDFRNHRNGQQLNTNDNPSRRGLESSYKPAESMSIYGNYSLAFQPRAGDQLSSLTVTNAVLEPEKFTNYEIGAKWDVNPGLSATAAIYRLDRTNVIVLDPTDPTNTRTMLSDGQRSEGLELGVTGQVTPAWSVSGGYAYTDAKFLANTSATLRAGARVGQVPKHTFSLWNRYDFTQQWGAGLGVVHQSSMLASNELIPTAANPTPNVELPGYTRVAAAVFLDLSANLSLQANVENLFDKKYYQFANSNTNITPGSPRSVRVALNALF